MASEESKSMLHEQQWPHPAPASGSEQFDFGEASTADEPPPYTTNPPRYNTSPPPNTNRPRYINPPRYNVRFRDEPDGKPCLARRYRFANMCASFRFLFSLPIVAASSYILSTGPSPAVLGFAAFSLACSGAHFFLAFSRAAAPQPATNNPLPPRHYLLLTFIASPITLLTAFIYGLAVIAMTAQYFGELDYTRWTECGGKTGPKKPCRPKTEKATVFDMTITCTVIAWAGMVCSLLQGYIMWRVSRYRYTEEEMEEVRKRVGRASWRLIALDEFVDWYRQKFTGRY